MLGLWCDKTYGSISKYNGGDEDGDNDRNKDGNGNKNAVVGLGFIVLIFYPITTSCSCLGLAGEYRTTTFISLQPQRIMYLRIRLYICPIKTIVRMCHKLLYAEIGVVDLCCWNMKKFTSWMNLKIDYIFDVYNGIPLIACPWFCLIIAGGAQSNQYIRPPKWCHHTPGALYQLLYLYRINYYCRYYTP